MRENHPAFMESPGPPPDGEMGGKFRRLEGLSRRAALSLMAAVTIAGGLWALELQHYLGLAVFKEQFLAVMLGLGLVATFVAVKTHTAESRRTVPWFDWILAAASLAVTAYAAVNYRTILHDLSNTSAERWAISALALALIFEATRRLVGWALVILAAIFILYARFGDLMPGLLAVPPSRWERIAVYLYFDTNGVLGIPLDVAATTIVSFVLFGAVLKAVKGDAFITDLALIAMGRYRGGPAKVSVGASTLFGTVSGSAVSNVAVVGPITIPMMTRAGYPAHQAGAIEAVSSTGGQMMPPVMGITAFLIADYLAIPYRDVVMAALIPALLYYLAVFIQIDLEAARSGLKGLSEEAIPKARAVLSQGYAFIVPLAILIYTVMIRNWEPGLAGMAAAGAALAMGMLRPQTRPSPASLWAALIATGRTMLDMLILTAIAGVVIGTLQLSGASFNMSTILLSFAGNNIISILLVTGIVCIVLGMAMPTAVIYTMLAVLVAPALAELGVVPIAAHLFLFYMGMLSMITPPVCLATFTAASIAKSDFWRTGFSGMRFGVVAYVIPFVFPFSLGLIMQGPWINIAISTLTAVIGVFGVCWGLSGYLFRPLGWVTRVLLGLSGLAILPSPTAGITELYLNAAGFAVGGAVLIWEVLAGRRSREVEIGMPAES